MIEFLKKESRLLFGPSRLGPSYPMLPEVSTSGETRIDGLYIKGDAAGHPLIKVGLNEGFDWVNDIKEEITAYKGKVDYDVIIIGSGATGFAAAYRAHELGLRYLVLEGERFANVVVNFTKGKALFSEPHSLEQKGSVWFEECSKEELLAKWHEQKDAINLNLHEFEKVLDIKGSKGNFTVISEKAEYKAAFVLAAIGKAGNPRKAQVPGEKEYPEKIYHFLADPDIYSNNHLLIYGGGDVACEAALALCDHNVVTMATIDKAFIYPKKRNSDAILAKAAEGKIDLHFNTALKSIEKDKATLVHRETNDEKTFQNDVVFEMIGAIPPLGFFKKIGVNIANSWHGSKILAGMMTLVVMLGLTWWAYSTGVTNNSMGKLLGGATFLGGLGILVLMGKRQNRYAWLAISMIISYTIYAAKTSSPHFPFHWIGHEAIHTFLSDGFLGWFIPNAVIAFKDAPSFWYSALYTFLVLFFGIKAMYRWGIKPGDKYQVKRYISIMSFQLVFFILVNVVLSVVIGNGYWRGWGLYQPFPLFFNTFFWWSESDPALIKYGFIGFGLFLTFIAIPIFVRFHGMRFCTWICGCGGLAETLGDAWRHLSPKGAKSQKWEFMGPMIVFWAFISLAVIVIVYDSSGSNAVWKTYDYIVDFWLVAVIPIGLYPFFGGKVWCRYWCPLAHYMKAMSKWFGTLNIVSNSKCISCTQCSTFCQVGVDVMSFAKNQVPFDNTNSACIHCGICITVCPMDVLSFDNTLKPMKTGNGLKIEGDKVKLST